MSENYPYSAKRCNGCAEIGLATKHPFLNVPAHYYKSVTGWVLCTASEPHPECVELFKAQLKEGKATL